MFKVKAICDMCKKEEVQVNKSISGGPMFYEKRIGWKNLKLEFCNSSYNYNTFLLCPDCQRKLGLLTQDANGKERETKVEVIADKLFNAISEIVAEQLSNQ